jgi:hypothetical protein
MGHHPQPKLFRAACRPHFRKAVTRAESQVDALDFVAVATGQAECAVIELAWCSPTPCKCKLRRGREYYCIT